MVSRYDNREIGINKTDLYAGLMDERNLKQIRQYFTGRLRFPTPSEIKRLQMVSHTWTTGDRYYKLAAKYYNNSKLWWIIAWFNAKPTEGHLRLGDVIQIPLPLDKVLKYLEV